MTFDRGMRVDAPAAMVEQRRVGYCCGLFALACCVACETGPALPLDVLGAAETVIEAKEVERLSDKRPTFDPALTIVEEFEGCQMRLNKSASVTRLTVKELDPGAANLKDHIFPTRGAALMALGSRTVLPSMEVVNGALKPFNDGLYASIELIAEHGANGSLVDKRATFDALLAAMLQRVARGDADAATAAGHFAAAAMLAGATPVLPATIAAAATEAREAFDRDVFSSTPIGFYTWSDELSRIFRRDRLLQTALMPGREGFRPAAAVSRALASDAELTARYRNVLELYRGLTNPSYDFDPVLLAASTGSLADAELSTAENAFAQAHRELDAPPPCQTGFSWLPASDSPERKLLASQLCAGGHPSNLLDALIAAIQSGAVNLTPTATSGWYDWQLYALETLLLPDRASENQHLLLTQKYRDKLIETFKSLLIQTRETHVKQLGTVTVPVSFTVPPREIDVYPLLVVEPFPTFYLRTARGYAFLRNLLAAALGPSALAQASRLLEDGSEAPLPLAEELQGKVELLYGLHLLAAGSIGMGDELSADERASLDPAAAERAARAWLAGWREDRDVLADPRVAVPVVRDTEARVNRNLAVVGVKVIAISASFPQGYEPEVTPEPSAVFGAVCKVRHFVPFEPYMLVEQTLEFERDERLPPLTRDALRALLDDQHSFEGMRAALEAQ